MPFKALLLLSIFIESSSAKIFEKCELAKLLEDKHSMSREDVKNWVCVAQYESTFNTEAINQANWDGSKDYGLFQLSNKYWCDDAYGKNECRIPCSDLLDDDLTDDLACIKKIIRDTENWKGKGTGLTAWVAYVNRCQNRDLDEYMSECWNDPTTTNEIVNRVESTKEPVEPEKTGEEEEKETASSGYVAIINLVRVPIMYHSLPFFSHLVNPYGYIYQQRYD
uniref:lysozyme n=1 Tax=Neocaridina davidi TaxID=1592667 RepID=A0A3G3CBB5_9EUCA|nr:lysozyme [Neocaridina davidi]